MSKAHFPSKNHPSCRYEGADCCKAYLQLISGEANTQIDTFLLSFAATRAISRRLQNSTVQLKEDAVNVGRAAVFWLLVLVAALYIIDSQ